MNYGKARWSGRVLGLSLLVLSAGMLGCVEDVGLIDRTQPNKVPKEIFQGVWYNVQTVVDVPATTGFSFVGETYTGPTATNKVIFDIQEKHLVVYPVFEYVEGSEREYAEKRKIRNYWKTNEDGELVDEFVEIYTGSPLASFPIESHFDVQRTYSAATGEESNVVEENTTDRKWWQRKYLRVNWGKNEIADFAFITRSIAQTGVDYYVQEWETDNPDRPILTDDLIMTTYKLFAQPQAGTACEAIQGSAYAADYDCAGAVIKVRNAFRKVPLNNDYVGQRYHVNLEQDKFGYFLSEHYSFDERFGITHEGKMSLIQRFNIWDKSREVVLEFPEASCMHVSDCEGVVDAESQKAANHCWQEAWFEPGYCVRWEQIPVSERPTRPIIYHLSAVWPEQLRREAYELAEEYDEVYRETVAWAQYWDARNMLHPKACETNADCAGHALLDVEFDTNSKTYSCASDVNKRTCRDIGNSTCDSQGWCSTYVPCAESNPCDRGQTCGPITVPPFTDTDEARTVNVCHEGGAPLLSRVARPDAVTLVLYDDGGATKHLEIRGEPTGNASQSTASVRFVNATPGSTGAVLELVDFGTNAAEAVGDPTNFSTTPDSFPFVDVALPAAESIRHLVVKVNGAEAARRTYVRLRRGHSYVVVFAGGDRVFAVENRLTSAGQTGVRVINAVVGETVDVGFNGALRGPGMELGDATEWLSETAVSNGKSVQRVTAVRAGDDANVTCYYFEGAGQCVGWKPAWDAAQANEIAQRRAAVPPMYVVCENVYTGDACEFDDNGDPADPTIMSDCRYSKLMEDGTITNPCKDRVPDHDRMKLHGDIRYNFLYWIPEEQMASPLGYGPSAADIDTGETFYGIAHVYGGPMETYGTYARDLVWLVNGQRDDGSPFGEEDILSSRYVREYIESVAPQGEYQSLTGALSTDDEAADAADHMATRRPGPALPQAFQHALATAEPPMARPEALTPELQRQMTIYDAAIQRALRSGEAFAGDDPGRARLDRIRGTWLEDLMITEEVKWGLTGSDPNGIVSLDKSKLSPASWMTMEARDAEHERIMHLARHNVMVADFADESMVHLARKLGCEQPGEVETDDMYDPDLGNGKCLAGQNLRWGVMARIFGGTLEHEVGHTVGLRHNFTGSTDPMNFQDEYFSIRERELVGCPLIATADGGIGSDRYCEVGEICGSADDNRIILAAQDDPGLLARYQCTTDDHCPNLTRCAFAPGATAGRCVDTYEREWGLCTKPQVVTLACQSDAECGANPATALCKGGICHERLACDTATACEEGQSCGGDGLCVDEAGAVVERVAETESLRPVRKLVPRPAPTQSEIDNNRMEYQYSSLMDYGGGINFDMHGLGKYDRAALMFGYGELVEVWQDTSGFEAYMRQAGEDYNDPYYQYGWQKDTSYWKYAGVITHPFTYLNDIVGIDRNLNRIPAPWRQVQLERNMVVKDYIRDAAHTSWIEVPYKFCSDEYRGQMTMGGCYYFDLGADILEIVYHSVVKLREYYVFDAFKREAYGRNMGGNANAYFARILDRWLRPLGDTGMYLGLYSGIFDQLSPIYMDVYRHSTFNAWALDTATRTALQTLTELIASPAPGTYVLDETAHEWVNVDYSSKLPKDELKEGEANIPFGMGKFPYTTFMDEGYWRYDHALWIGSFWEKMAALLTMTDSSANFLSDYVGEQLNVGVGTSVGFNTAYSAIMGNFLGGLVAEAPEFTAGTMDPATREYRTRNVLDLQALDDPQPTVPNSIDNLTMKLYAAVYGLSYMPAGFDPSFVDSLAVTIKGSGSEYTLGDAVETIEFTDPFGHKTYIAHRSNYDQDIEENGAEVLHPYDDLPRLDVAYRIVELANAAKTKWEEATDPAEKAYWGAEMDRQREVLDLLRTLNEIYGDIVY